MKSLQFFKTSNKLCRVAIAISIAISSANVIAEENNDTKEEQGLERIIVHAQKTAQVLNEVPISVSAIGKDKIQDAGMQNIEDASLYVPNFSINQDSIGDRINIRGVQSGNQAGFEQSVATFVDGVYRGRGVQSRFAFLDVEMVEVLRGPQSTLFGKNTVGGALNIRSARPTDEFEGNIRTSYNIDFDEVEIGGYISGALSDSVRGRFTFIDRNRKEGWIHNVYHNSDDPMADESAFRASIEWDLSDSTLLNFKAEHGTLDNSGGPWEIIEAGPLAALGIEDNIDGITNIGAQDPVLDFGSSLKMKGEYDEYSLTVEHDLEFAYLTGIISHSNYNFDRNLAVDYNPLSIARFDDSEDFEQTTVELRISGDNAGNIDYIAGLFYLNSTLKADGLSQISVPDTHMLLDAGCLFNGGVKHQGDPLDPTDDMLATVIANAQLGTLAGVAGNCAQSAALDAILGTGSNLPGVARYAMLDQETTSLAIFAQMTYQFADDWSTTLGLRYSDEEKVASQLALAPAYAQGNKTELADPLTTAAAMTFLEFTPHAYTKDDLTRKEDGVDWSLRLQWDANSDSMYYASIATGSKAGGFNSFYMGDKPLAIGMPGNHNPDDAEFEGESVITYELGSKLSLLDGNAELSAAIFHTSYDDLQVSVFSGNTTFDVQNAAQATITGLELDGRWKVTDKLLLSGGFGWIDFEYDDFKNQACTNAQLSSWSEQKWAGGANPLAVGLNNAHCAAAGINDQSGNAAANTPELSAILSATYKENIGKYNLDFTVDVVYTDEIYRQDDLDPVLLADATTKINGSIKLTAPDNSWHVALIGKNLTNVDDDFYWGNDMPLVSGASMVAVSEHRNISVVASINF